MKQSLELSYNNRNNPKRLISLYFSAEVGVSEHWASESHDSDLIV